MAPISKEEVESVLKSMQRDKSPGPDGWTAEFFQHFFEFIGDELVAVVEDSRHSGSIYQPFNATFLALIPKSDHPVSFSDFRPISLCTCVYKIIAKIIAVRLKPFLSKNISLEKFGFLDGRQIHEAVGVAQEMLHSLKFGKKKGVVVKIDLSKAYDRISSMYLRLLLTHLGFRYEFVTHLLFVDDIILFSNGSLEDCRTPKRILDLFLKSTGLCINERKSTLTCSGLSRELVRRVELVLNFEVKSLEDSFKYLGFFFKPDNYRIKDWHWILAKLESKLKHWSYKWLSRAGRLVLIKYVLMAIPVYWDSLTWVPKGILNSIEKLCSRFLWAGSKSKRVILWIAWDKIARPKEWGGWGIKNLACFSQSLAAKLAWRLNSNENLWTSVSKRKYIDPLSTLDWIRLPQKSSKNSSVIWKVVVASVNIIEKGLAWSVGDGIQIRLGRDPWIGCSERFSLSQGLVLALKDRGLYTLNQVVDPRASTIWSQGWFQGRDLNLNDDRLEEWDWYIRDLLNSSVRLSDSPDELKWVFAQNGFYSPKSGYNWMMSQNGWENPDWWAKSLWKLKGPAKSKLFF
eukprot:PITA_17522